jgi:hypothetical protein
MNEQPPSKEQLIERLNYSANGCEFMNMPETARICREAIAEITRLREDNRRWENARNVWMAEEKRLKAQVEELSIHAEKWVKRALGGDHSWYGGQVNEEACKQLVKLNRDARKPAHEREMPHCSTCACPPFEPRPDISSYTVECPPIVADYRHALPPRDEQ